MPDADPQARLDTLNELFKRLFVSAPPTLRDEDTPFSRKIGEWVDLHARITRGAAELLPTIGPWIAIYNELRDEVQATPGTTPPPRARSIVDRILDVPAQLADYAESAAWGVGGVVVLLGGLWLWSGTRSRR